ncbi:hypothetical protein VTN77DRAFT_4746 [Rasamsonia byssochlamydoides]|uniref:uncharacterized protein n=1 Tax=Rasamsonia byssochlamydoides TaxID=89139 RepID=UPI003741ED07
MGIHMSRTRRLWIVICVSTTFFLVEISAGFYTRSLALVADAFHYLNDLIGFIVALVALRISSKKDSPPELSFGWQRAQLLGAFFNGVFLLALGVSILLQSIERFVSLQRVENPKLVFIVGCIGLGLNLISATFLHEHDHTGNTLPAGIEEGGSDSTNLSLLAHNNHRHHNISPKRKTYDLGILGVLLHVIGDAINNIGVIISALVIWFATYDGRFYADPAVSVGIAVMVLLSSLPLVRKSGTILLESVPSGVNLSDVKYDLELIPGVISVHELHVWRLNQQKSLASVHITVPDCKISEFTRFANTINECFHAYGIHSATVQPELAASPVEDGPGNANKQRSSGSSSCQISCGAICEELTCCG